MTECPPLKHNYTHNIIRNVGPYKKLTMILIYCTKCGEVRFKEMV